MEPPFREILITEIREYPLLEAVTRQLLVNTLQSETNLA
jgi:hypothetical protein